MTMKKIVDHEKCFVYRNETFLEQSNTEKEVGFQEKPESNWKSKQVYCEYMLA